MKKLWAFARRALGRVRRAMSPELRSVRKLERHLPDRLLQPYATTGWNRHLPLFNAVRDALIEVPEPRLLSFGCSTGEEAFSLSELIPSARITAIDINPRSITIARRTARRIGAQRIEFKCAAAPLEGDSVEPFDAIFCLSVLRHGRLEAEGRESCSALLPFERAEALLHSLDDLLNPGGYLVVWGSNFRLSDTDLADRYTWIPVPGKKPQRGLYYGRDDRRLDVEFTQEFLFRKTS